MTELTTILEGVSSSDRVLPSTGVVGALPRRQAFSYDVSAETKTKKKHRINITGLKNASKTLNTLYKKKTKLYLVQNITKKINIGSEDIKRRRHIHTHTTRPVDERKPNDIESAKDAC